MPTNVPIDMPTNVPIDMPTNVPIDMPTNVPIDMPTNVPSIPHIDPSKLTVASIQNKDWLPDEIREIYTYELASIKPRVTIVKWAEKEIRKLEAKEQTDN